MMLTFNGIYDGKGGITLLEAVPFHEPYNVLVTFLKPSDQPTPTVDSAPIDARAERLSRQ